MFVFFMTQCPPSYDQVIKEKTEEVHTVKPTAAPRRITATSGTQTDAVPHCSAAPQPVKKGAAGEPHVWMHRKLL